MNSKETDRGLRGLVESLRRTLIVTVLLAVFWFALYSVEAEIPGFIKRIDVFSIPMWLNIVLAPPIVFLLNLTGRVLVRSDREYDEMILSLGTAYTLILSLPIALSAWAPEYHLEHLPRNFLLPVIFMVLLVARIISPYILLLFGLLMTLISPIGSIVGVFTLLLFLTCPKICREIITELRTIELPEFEPSRKPFLLPPKRQWLKTT